jgi:hypothetical protein
MLNNYNQNKHTYIGFGMVVGLVFGGLLGLLTGNMVIFAGGGMVLGFTIGAALDNRSK